MKWRTATDPPEESGEYLCTDGQTVFMAWYHAQKQRWFDSDGATYFVPVRVAHWMNKPPLPKEAANDP